MSKKNNKEVEEDGSESEEEFSVEKILDKRIINGKVNKYSMKYVCLCLFYLWEYQL